MKWTNDRIIIMVLLSACGGWPFLFYFIPKWRREDAAQGRGEG